jgi:hypothetical protein
MAESVASFINHGHSSGRLPIARGSEVPRASDPPVIANGRRVRVLGQSPGGRPACYVLDALLDPAILLAVTAHEHIEQLQASIL